MADPDSRETRSTISGGVFFSAVVQGRDITLQLPPEITPALSGFPPGTPAFTGRDADLRILLDILAPSGASGDSGFEVADATPTAAVVVAAVGGLAGIGKTELAVQAAHTALSRGWFPGGVLFADLFGYDPARKLNPGQALEGFLHALAIPGEHIPPHTHDRARLYASVLAAYAREGRRILVVIDNAATHEQAKPLLPAEPGGAAIVTSRDTLGLLDARLLDLDTLAPGDAANMLDQVLRVSRPGDARVTDHPSAATRIARLCGGLPLALRIVAALLSENPDRPLAELATDLDDEHTRLDELSSADTAVRAAFDLSYQRLHPGQAQLFRLLTLNPGPEISTEAASVLADVDLPAARRELEALARAHLVDQGRSYGRWHMHDLLRLYAGQLSDACADADRREQARDRLLRYYLDTAEAANAHLQDPHYTPEEPAFLRHFYEFLVRVIEKAEGHVRLHHFADRDGALAWLDAEQPNLIAAVIMAASTGRDQIAIQLSFNLAGHFSWRWRLDDVLDITTVSRDAAQRGRDRGTEATALDNLGIALREAGRFEEAITTLQRAAKLFRKTGYQRHEGHALIRLGSALVGMRRFEEAITTLQRAAKIFRRTSDRQGEGDALNELGGALKEAGLVEEAITACQDAAAIFRETGDRHGEGMALNNLGIALREAGLVGEAITACQGAAAIFRETGDRHGEGMALNNLGSALQEVGRLDEAITAHKGAAKILRETGDRNSEGDALTNLGSTLREAGRFEEAITACQGAAAFFRETGDRHGEGLALGNLGLALREAGRFMEGIRAHQNAAAIFRETGDRDRESLALNDLELDQATQGT
jgi:tetratricopeptide (TPR) repeat protein